ncbi:hypothetical protein IHE49_13510 [Rhodanobacter sp. 7MK24]|uniref:hypothetical protein n=1 Tax=Rhodanobacter sp. 7MK24 TaxID=2775922 RepID=UPI0017864383|nr:hypothetical protein [Rhodanobacter sp. 7MK24]MBD8881499.1 hypothetical protein [Rhodanobacter sp. 7MK24]
MAMLVMGHAGNAVAQEGASSGNRQLQRLLIDYHIAQIMQLGVQRGIAQLPPSSAQNAVLLQMSRQLGMTSDATFAEIVTPSLRDCISEDRARVVADFLETGSGQALIAWVIQSFQHPGQAIPRPDLDRNLAQSFEASGGSAALKQFSVCVNDPARQQQMAVALVHYATRQPGDAN